MKMQEVYLCHGVTLSVSNDIYQKITFPHLKILKSLYIRMTVRAKHSPSHAMYSTVSQDTLAEYHSLSREWINALIGDLHDWGLIIKERCRPIRGMWQTCLYKLGSVFHQGVNKVKEAIQTMLHHVNSTSHIVTETIYKKEPTAKNKDFSIKLKDPPLEEIILRMEKAHPELQKEREKDG